MLAIIPARGGSKGVPRKNVKLLAGIPLIAYTINAAKDSGVFSRILVSTDSQEIADISLAYGAEVPFLRPAELASDDSPAIDTYLYTINRLEDEYGQEIREICVLQPTTPLRKSSDIQEACKLFKVRNADSVISYTKERHPVQWHKYVNDELKFEEIFDSNNLSNRQDFRPSYYPNGAIFIFKKALIQQRKYYNENSCAFLMPGERSVDIDDMLDFQFTEFLLAKST